MLKKKKSLMCKPRTDSHEMTFTFPLRYGSDGVGKVRIIDRKCFYKIMKWCELNQKKRYT